jgi:cephalosporin hydroxylase
MPSLRLRNILLLALLALGIGYELYRQRIRFEYQLLKPVTVKAFHRLHYGGGSWANNSWLGTEVLKSPLDLWIFQEIICQTQPDVIVEAGTYKGGSALFMANILDLLGHGQVVTIDIEEMPGRPQHPRIHYLLGSSTAPETVEKVRTFLSPKDKVMVVLDSDHRKPHVLQELRIYSRMVTKGNYLIVEDTNLNGHPVHPDFGPGPMEAVEEFLRENNNFQIDSSREKFLVTFNPKGYLRKIRD